MPTAMRSSSRDVLGQHAAEDELADEQAEQRERLLHADAAADEHRDREHRLRGGEEQLLALQRVEREAVQRARRRSRTRSGSEPTSSVHWLTFDDSSVPSPALVCSRHANIPAMRAPAPPTRAARATARGGTCRCPPPRRGARATRRTARRRRRSPRRRTRAGCRRRCVAAWWAASPISRAGPDEMRLLGRRPRRCG